jgi:phosphoserine phosphatase RsbU/P
VARLIVQSGPDAGTTHPLTDEVVSIGRSSSSTIQIADKRASRHNTILRAERGNFVAEDLGSKNGTLLNDAPLVGRVMLKSGDRLQIGDTSFVFEKDPSGLARPADTTKSGRVRMVDDGVHGAVEEVRLDSSSGAYPSPVNVERALLRDPFERLKVLYQVSDSIRSILGPDELLVHILDILWNVAHPDRGVILLRDEVENTLEPMVVRTQQGGEDEVAVSRSIVERAMEEQVAILVSDAPSDIRFASSESLVLSRIRSVICAPMVFKNEVLGVLYIDALETGGVSYTQEELELVTGIANQAAVALTNARLYRDSLERRVLEHELEIARRIQTNLLPRGFPRMSGVTISAESRPARMVGGDFYDFIELEDGRVAIVVADVSGKGVPAALLSATIRASVRMESHLCGRQPVSSVVKAVNRWTCSDSRNSMFATMFYGVYDPTNSTIEYTNAGHMHPLLFRAGGEMSALDEGGCFLGIMEEVDYQVGEVSVHSGDTLLFYTDGVTDTHNAQLETFGVERLANLAREGLSLEAPALRDSIYEATRAFRGEAEQFDDLTIIVAKFNL